MATQMLSVQKAPFGLGPMVHGQGRALHFGHEGVDEGFLSEIVYFPQTAQGACVMVNGAGGGPLLHEVLYAVAAEYGWPEYGPDPVTPIAVDDATLDRIVGTYEGRIEVFPIVATFVRQGQALVVDVPRLGTHSEVVFTSPTKVTVLDDGDELELVLDSQGHVTGLQLGDVTIPRRAAGP
jgi:hypothetical protein